MGMQKLQPITQLAEIFDSQLLQIIWKKWLPHISCFSVLWQDWPVHALALKLTVGLSG